MVKFYLVRHGETDWNLQGRFQGIENIPLNETGLAQALRCGKGLKSCGIPFDCIVASPLDRARVTAETIAGFVGSVEVKVDERLIERDFGKVSGRKKEERETMLASGLDLQMEDESLVADRMQAVLEDYSNAEYKHVILVSHGASIRALLGKYCEAGSVPTVAVQQNAYVTVITFDGSKFYMEAYDRAPEDLEMLMLEKGRPQNTDRLPKEMAVYDLLDELGIEYERIDHEALFTMEACLEVDKALGMPICKNLFLCNSQKTKFYLLLMPGDKKFVTKDLSKQIGSARLSFGPAEYMEEFLNITPGSVSVMGLMNDKENRIQLLIDKDVLKEEYFGCHPCINTSSLKMKTADIVEKFLPAVHHEYIEVEL